MYILTLGVIIVLLYLIKSVLLARGPHWLGTPDYGEAQDENTYLYRVRVFCVIRYVRKT